MTELSETEVEVLADSSIRLRVIAMMIMDAAKLAERVATDLDRVFDLRPRPHRDEL